MPNLRFGKLGIYKIVFILFLSAPFREGDTTTIMAGLLALALMRQYSYQVSFRFLRELRIPIFMAP